MTRTYVNLILLFVVLFLLQVGILNSIHLFGVATPFVFVYCILKLPVEMNRNLVLLLAAFCGLLMDLFTYTLGLNMLALTVVGFLRHYAIKFLGPREVFDNLLPSFSAFGRMQFLVYSGSLLFLNLLVLYGVESLTFFNPLRFVLLLISSFLFSMLLIIAFEIIAQGLSEK